MKMITKEKILLVGSGTTLAWLGSKLVNSGISSSVREEMGRAAITCAISSSVVGAVT